MQGESLPLPTVIAFYPNKRLTRLTLHVCVRTSARELAEAGLRSSVTSGDGNACR